MSPFTYNKIKNGTTLAAKTRNRWIIAVGILAYLFFLVALFPINMAHKLIKPEGLPVEIVGLTGTLWDGGAVLKHPSAGRVDLDWRLHPSSLLMGSLNVDIDLKSPVVRLNGNAKVGAGRVLELNNIDGYLTSDVVNGVLRSQRTQIEGDLELSKANLVYDLGQRKAELAEGRLVWQGGNVQYPAGRQKKSSKMPMLVANLRADQGNILATVTSAEGDVVAEANVKSDGWAGVAIKRRLIDLAGEQWPNKAQPDTTVFEVSEKIF